MDMIRKLMVEILSDVTGELLDVTARATYKEATLLKQHAPAHRISTISEPRNGGIHCLLL
jgi:uncharacterized protein (DUF111 family)